MAKLNLNDLAVTSFETSTASTDDSLAAISTPRCPTPATMCFVCPVSSITECPACDPTLATACFICPPLTYDCADA